MRALKNVVIRGSLCGILAIGTVAAAATTASASGWVSWQSREYSKYSDSYLHSDATGNGSRFYLSSDSAKDIYDWHLSNGNWLENPYDGGQCMEVNGSNGNLDTWSCAYDNQANEQWDESEDYTPGNTCWYLVNAQTGQLVDADAASGNYVGVSDSSKSCGGLYSNYSGIDWQ